MGEIKQFGQSKSTQKGVVKDKSGKRGWTVCC